MSQPKQKPQPQQKPGEFARFEELARKLVSVPKAEVDKEKAKYESEKEKRPANR